MNFQQRTKNKKFKNDGNEVGPALHMLFAIIQRTTLSHSFGPPRPGATSPLSLFSSPSPPEARSDRTAMLQSQLHDVSSDSIPLLLLAVVARSVHHVRSLLLALLHSLPLSRSIPRATSDSADAAIGSGLAGLIALADHLNQNRFSSRQCPEAPGGGFGAPDCVVCLSALREGEQVRELGCRHVFHKACLDGWLQHLNFNCPLCRSPLASGEGVDAAGRRVGGELMEWFSLR